MKQKQMTSLLLFVSLFVSSQARVYETFDSVVIEADDVVKSVTESEVYEDDSVVINSDLFDPDDPHERSCWTFDNKHGTCTPVRECYPYTKVHQLDNLETWVIGTKGTCNYIEPSGRQVYGVCCDKSSERSIGFGLSSINRERIVQGINAVHGEWPFMVGIFSGGRLYCGGSLIDDLHVLTAAHCVSQLTSRDVARLSVLLGATSIKRKELSSVTRRVRSITRHKGFDSVKLYNDVALITLDYPVEYSNQISPVCLSNERDLLSDGTEAVVLGWGNLYEDGPRPDVLQKTNLRIKSQEDCQRNFGSRAPGGIVDHMVCAYAPGKDACSGDSGGPLMVNKCQVGIVSWGIGCATDKYGVYTRVSSFRKWIDRNRLRY